MTAGVAEWSESSKVAEDAEMDEVTGQSTLNAPSPEPAAPNVYAFMVVLVRTSFIYSENRHESQISSRLIHGPVIWYRPDFAISIRRTCPLDSNSVVAFSSKLRLSRLACRDGAIFFITDDPSDDPGARAMHAFGAMYLLRSSTV